MLVRLGVLLSAASFVLVNPAYAQSGKPKKMVETEVSDDEEVEVKTETRTRKRSNVEQEERLVETNYTSAYNRKNKQWSLVAQPIGFINGLVSAFGLTGGYYYDPDMLFELDYAQGETNLLLFKVYSTQMAGRVKKFWGNSFYTNGGVGTRLVGIKDNLENLTGQEVSVELANTVLGLDFQLGNRWQFENFSIGCDWIGAFVPLSKLGDKSTMPADTNAADRKEAEDGFNTIAKMTTYQLLRFYIGASW